MSIINQVNMCIREIDMIGKSKKKARANHVKGIHSYKTKKEVLKISKQFANWVRREHGVKNLHEVTQGHFKAFLDAKSHTSLDYRRGIETHLRLLQEGLNKRSESFGKEKVQFTTEKRLIAPRGRNEGVSDRSMQSGDTNALKAKVSLNVRNSIDLMYRLGLRVSGSVSVKVGHVDFDRNIVSVTEKGGRTRRVRIPEGFKDGLASMIHGKEKDDRIVPIAARSVQNEVKRVAKEQNIKSYTGTHAFRHTYARHRVSELMTETEKQLFDSCLERYEQGKDFDYGVHDKSLYNAMKSKMDKIHHEIGHGKNRYDLAIRYMKTK